MDKKDLNVNFIEQLPMLTFLEGIRFYVSFACSFAFGELKLMEGSTKIISLIAREMRINILPSPKIY